MNILLGVINYMTIKTISERRKLITEPSSTLIEKTALEFACEWYEAALSSGLLPSKKQKSQKAWARANFHKFIPKVIETFVTMLGDPNQPDKMKKEIWAAIQERINDPEMVILNNMVENTKGH